MATEPTAMPSPLQLDWGMDERLDEAWRPRWEAQQEDGEWLRYFPDDLFAIEAGDRAATPVRALHLTA